MAKCGLSVPEADNNFATAKSHEVPDALHISPNIVGPSWLPPRVVHRPLLCHWISNWFSITTHLVLVLVGATLQKKPKAPSFQKGSGWNFAGMFFTKTCIDGLSRIYDLMTKFEDGSHEAISHRTVLHPCECTCSIRNGMPGILQQHSNSSWSLVHSYLFYKTTDGAPSVNTA